MKIASRQEENLRVMKNASGVCLFVATSGLGRPGGSLMELERLKCLRRISLATFLIFFKPKAFPSRHQQLKIEI